MPRLSVMLQKEKAREKAKQIIIYLIKKDYLKKIVRILKIR